MADAKESPSSPVETTVLVPVGDSTEALLMRAVESGASVDTMERLMAMRRELRDEAAKEAFFKALAAFQAECPVITKSRKVYNTGGKTERYRYASLEDIIRTVGPLLKAHGLSYRVDTCVMGENKPTFAAKCIVHHVAGHSEASEFIVPVETSGRMNAAQEYGSAGTYAKRYAFCNALGILTGDEDDDGRGSGKGAHASSAPPKTTQAPPKEPDPTPVTVKIAIDQVLQNKDRNGKPYYKIVSGVGTYRTFHKSHAELAKIHAGTGEKLVVTFENTKYGPQLTDIHLQEPPTSAAPPTKPRSRSPQLLTREYIPKKATGAIPPPTPTTRTTSPSDHDQAPA